MNENEKEMIFADSFSESVFARAVIDDFEREIAAAKADDTPVEFSERHKRRMNSMFARERRRARVRRVFAIARRAVAVILLLAALNAVLFSVPAVRAAVGTVIEWFGKYTKFANDITPADYVRWEPFYLPDGFVETERFGDYPDMTVIVYTNMNDNMLTFTEDSVENSLSINNENVEYRQVVYEGITYHTFSALIERYSSSVVWDMSGRRFSVVANLPMEELLAVARSVKRV